MIAQQIRLKGWPVPLFAAPWAQGENLLQIGGKAVEGMEIIIPFDINNPSPALRAFKTRYQARFAHPPVFTAMYGYETMQMLAIALEKTGGKATGLPQTLLELGDFEGLTGPIRLDEYGDALRPLYIQRIHAGKFETIETLSPVP